MGAKLTDFTVIGAFAGTLTSVLGNELVHLRCTHEPHYLPSAPVPSLTSSAVGLFFFMSLYANLRYQFINGMDRYAFDCVPHLSVYLGITTLTRALTHPISKDQQVHLIGMHTGRRTLPGNVRRKMWRQ